MMAAMLYINSLPARAGSPQTCDRACLSGHVDRYLEAMAAHDPKRLPLAPNVKFTENGQAMALGDGLWATVKGLRDYRFHFNDVKTGQAGAMALVQENDHPALMSLRLKIRGGKITEVETIVSRGDPAASLKIDGLQDKPIFAEALAPADRRSRTAMVGTVKDYLNALIVTRKQGDVFDLDCTRVENGMRTANNPAATDKLGKLNCGDQLDTGASEMLTRVREPRFLMVDEERGLVHVVMFFDHASTKLSATAHFKDGSTQPMAAHNQQPYSFMCAEVFKLKGGKVRQIEVTLLSVPYRMQSGWPASPNAGL
jgi:hypothetical protein